MHRIGRMTFRCFMLGASLVIAQGCKNTSKAGREGRTQATQPAAAPAPHAGGAANATHSPVTAPVLVVWRRIPGGTGADEVRLEYAAWTDGIVLYRRNLPKSPQALMVGRLNVDDVQRALYELEGNGFFRSEPFKFASSGMMIMARNKGHANSMTTDRPLTTMTPEESPASMKSDLTLWNTMVESIQALRETIDSDEFAAIADSNGMYRGYNSRKPEATWWISDAGQLWQPSKAAENRASGTRSSP